MHCLQGLLLAHFGMHVLLRHKSGVDDFGHSAGFFDADAGGGGGRLKKKEEVVVEEEK